MRKTSPTVDQDVSDLDQLWTRIVKLDPGINNDLAETAWFVREINRIGDAIGVPRLSRYAWVPVEGKNYTRPVATNGLDAWADVADEGRNSMRKTPVDVPLYVI